MSVCVCECVRVCVCARIGGLERVALYYYEGICYVVAWVRQGVKAYRLLFVDLCESISVLEKCVVV